MILPLEKRSRSAFRRRLLHWYDANKRSLPWRQTRDPYRIWLSEIMLQQTRVTAVIPHYKRFLAAFPTVKALARADEQAVLAQWSGLGYYRRARMMHAAAKQLAAEKKPMPRTTEGLRELPGIGRYTAAAIASIAFSEPAAVVDGNVERVLLRIAGRDEGADLDHWTSAQQLLDTQRPGDFNQAMMELGATVCLPQNPICSRCPVKKWCATRGAHATVVRAARKTATIGYLLATTAGRIALTQRPSSARLMPGMWELPQIAGPLPRRKPLLTIRHSITTTDYFVNVWRGKAPRASVQSVLMTEAAKLPLTGLTRKVLRRLELLKI